MEDTLPQSLTVKKGLLVLIRQWKNVLYMPMLADPSFKVVFFVMSRVLKVIMHVSVKA